MERGSGGFNVLDKKSLSNSDFFTSTKLQISMMGAHHHGTNLDRPFVGDDDGGGYGGGVAGPNDNSGGGNEAGGTMYRHGGAANFGQNNLQPFNIFPSPQGGMIGFPFTAAQMKELERQALIYKYMISSVPVPLHLLPQLSRNFPESSLPSIYSGRYAKNGDPEPGRCKRTDGKKWRCSKEVAPQQKYCERHLHRGRPRSRKPVEVKDQNHKKTRLIDQNQNKSLPTAKSDSVSAAANEPILLLNAKTDLTISTPPYYNREGRIVASEQPWEGLMKSNCYIPQEYVEEQQPLDHVFSYPNLPTGGFIDAWSIDNLNTRNTKHSISLNDGDLDLSPSLNLSMAMAAGDIVDREMRNINVEDHKTKDSMWLSPVSWGPLGEALAVGGSNPASPYSTPATTVSSPSGVLHWTLFSQSDSSVCSSPTFVAPPSEGSNPGHN